jgi:hypothetical protein
VLVNGGARTTPAAKAAIAKLGHEFEFRRSDLPASVTGPASAALRKLCQMFGVTPEPQRATHDGRTPIVIKARGWRAAHEELWQRLVPSTGAAATVQGEVIRIAGKLAHELGTNRGCHWDANFAAMRRRGWRTSRAVAAGRRRGARRGGRGGVDPPSAHGRYRPPHGARCRVGPREPQTDSTAEAALRALIALVARAPAWPLLRTGLRTNTGTCHVGHPPRSSSPRADEIHHHIVRVGAVREEWREALLLTRLRVNSDECRSRIAYSIPMSYSVDVYPIAFKVKCEKAKGRNLHEDPANLVPFDDASMERILEQLELVGFTELKKDSFGRHFLNREWPAEALLHDCGLYLSAHGEGVFEILMFGSEISEDTLARYDPQQGTWE